LREEEEEKRRLENRIELRRLELQAEASAWSRVHQTISDLTRKVEELEDGLEEERTKRRSVEDKLAAIEREKEDVEARLLKKVEALEMKLAKVENEKNDLIKERRSLEKRLKELEERMDKRDTGPLAKEKV
jgi:chromosome segregation ATPase